MDQNRGISGSAGESPSASPKVLTFTSSSFVPQEVIDAARGYTRPIVDAKRLFSEFGLERFMSPADPDSLRLRKGVAVVAQVAGIAFTAFWYVLFLALGQNQAAWLNLGYNSLCVLNLIVFAFTRNMAINLNIAFGLVTLYVVAVQLMLGGIHSAGFVVIWGLLTPLLGSILFGRRASIVWLVIFLSAMSLSVLIECLVPLPRPTLPPSFGLVNSVLNVGAMSALAAATNYALVTRLDAARGRADNLLLNILPAAVAMRLKEGQTTLAEQYSSVSILFADIVGFTSMASCADPVTLVALLNAVFSKFDRLAEELGLEKIKTIGDAYMVAAGLPQARADHADAIARMALGMLESIANQLDCEGKPLQIRVGVHSGPVVAGVIGRKKFSYDLWGDVVNIASRMESTGEPGRVHVSQTTYEMLSETFHFEPRGPIAVKGRGELQTYFLVRAGGA